MPESQPAVEVSHLSKRYRLGATVGRSKRLTESLSDAMRRLLGQRPASASDAAASIWALRDVSLTVEPGEALGLIGRNGAGKSTMLKILSRITDPTEGSAIVRGRVGSLLEVGTGFHPELTGRENVYLNGAILGMHRPEIRRKFDEIVAFAEIETFLDTPVKRFSSGMYMRLAFAVAAHLEPEILLVDEVLAVGDLAFQERCLGRMGEVAHQGRTVIFVSHNLGAIRSLCPRAIWLEQGRIAGDGPSERVVADYVESARRGAVEGFGFSSTESSELSVRGVRIASCDGASEIRPGGSLVIELQYHCPVRVERPRFWFVIVSKFGPLIGANMLIDGHCPDYVEGDGVLTCTFHALPLLPQTYTVGFGARKGDGVTSLFEAQDIGMFHVEGSVSRYGLGGDQADQIAWDSASVMLPYEWGLPDGRRVAVDGLLGGGLPIPQKEASDRAVRP